MWCGHWWSRGLTSQDCLNICDLFEICQTELCRAALVVANDDGDRLFLCICQSESQTRRKNRQTPTSHKRKFLSMSSSSTFHSQLASLSRGEVKWGTPLSMSAGRELWSADYLCWKLGHFKNHLSERKNEECVGEQIPRQFHTTSLITSLFLGVMTRDHWSSLPLCVANHEKHCSKAKARA